MITDPLAGATSRQINEARRIQARRGRVQARVLRDGTMLLDVLGDACARPYPSVTVAVAPDGRVVDAVEHVAPPEANVGDIDAFDARVLDELHDWLSDAKVARAVGVPVAFVRATINRLVMHGAVEVRRHSQDRIYYRRADW